MTSVTSIPDKYGCMGRCTFYNADKAPLESICPRRLLVQATRIYQVAHDLTGSEETGCNGLYKTWPNSLDSVANRNQLPFEKVAELETRRQRSLFGANPDATTHMANQPMALRQHQHRHGGKFVRHRIQLLTRTQPSQRRTLFSPNIVEKWSLERHRFGSSVIELTPNTATSRIPQMSGRARMTTWSNGVPEEEPPESIRG